jgi:hypothetical protein
MAHRGFNLPVDLLLAARKAPADKHIHSNLSLTADGFDNWWQKTFAQHTAMAAEASALLRAHRRVNSADQARTQQAH